MSDLSWSVVLLAMLTGAVLLLGSVLVLLVEGLTRWWRL